jgi:hypothetical protein
MHKRTDYPDKLEWALERFEVSYIHLDHRFGFDLLGFDGSSGYLKVVVNVPFVLSDGRNGVLFDPEDVNKISGALTILHKLARKLTVYRDGALEVDFQDGVRLRVEKHAQYESWEMQGEGELQDVTFLCSPHDGPPWRE